MRYRSALLSLVLLSACSSSQKDVEQEVVEELERTTWYADCDCDGVGVDDFTREVEGIKVPPELKLPPEHSSCSAGGCWSQVGGDRDDSDSWVR